MTLSVARASSADTRLLADLAARTFPLACPPGSDPEDIARFIAAALTTEHFAEYVDDPQRIVLLATDPEPVGYAMLVTTTPTDPDVIAALSAGTGAAAPAELVEISKFYVDARAHGHGVATALMSAVTNHADETRLWLGVNQRNHRAQKFYAASGFRVVGHRRFALGEDIQDDFVMARP